LDSSAGYEFVKLIKKDVPYMPVLMQSSELENKKKCESLGAYFLHKDSPTLLQDFRHFLLERLGFGDFVFLLPDSYEEIASNLEEFEYFLQKIPLESILLHGGRNDFSNWLRRFAELSFCRNIFYLHACK
jgi:hypothetical protein